MVDYSIAAIPTEYRGRTYRSRLEARWAAFFDRLGLRHEYEPFDLGAWSPDFLLTDIDTLVEVKPLTDFDPDVWLKMTRACKERGLDKAVVLTMVAPILDKVAYVGWAALPWYDPSLSPLRVGIGWYSLAEKPGFVADLTCITRDGFFSTSGEALTFKDFSLRTAENVPMSYSTYVMEQWARATSDVQWRPDEEA